MHVTKQFVAGIIGSPHGLNGCVKVKPLSGEINHLLSLQSATVRKDGQERLLAIEESRALPPVVHMRFAGYSSPEEAKTLIGAQLLVERKNAAPLQEDEFYIEDLKGLMVTTEGGNGEILGTITALFEGGGGDLAEITLSNGKIHLVPFRKEFFSVINLKKGQVILTNLWILE